MLPEEEAAVPASGFIVATAEERLSLEAADVRVLGPPVGEEGVLQASEVVEAPEAARVLFEAGEAHVEEEPVSVVEAVVVEDDAKSMNLMILGFEPLLLVLAMGLP